MSWVWNTAIVDSAEVGFLGIENAGKERKNGMITLFDRVRNPVRMKFSVCQ